jgi:hypothetical protein
MESCRGSMIDELSSIYYHSLSSYLQCSLVLWSGFREIEAIEHKWTTGGSVQLFTQISKNYAVGLLNVLI